MGTLFEGAFDVTEVGAWREFGGKLFQPLDLGLSWPSVLPIQWIFRFFPFPCYLKRENPNRTSASRAVPFLPVSLLWLDFYFSAYLSFFLRLLFFG